MTIAELHGKLSSSSPESITDRMEDLLTSDVFGTMKYAGVDCGFLDWLHTAVPMPFVTGLPPISDQIPADNLNPSAVAAIASAKADALPRRHNHPGVWMLRHASEESGPRSLQATANHQPPTTCLTPRVAPGRARRQAR